jgi:hypothetical protein
MADETAHYRQVVMSEQLNLMVLRRTIDDFLTSFANHQGLGADQRTVLFFPGGMASELVRADQQFDANLPEDAHPYGYDSLWYDVFKIVVLLEATMLDMSGDFDQSRQLIVADGPVKTCVYSPYDGFENWCAAPSTQLDLLTVGWDFRRPYDWTLEFVFDHLVPYVRQCAADAGLSDPFENLSLVGHSFGGMIVKWMLNDHTLPLWQNLQVAVTVGAPFYGYAGQSHRYFEGEPLIGTAYNLPNLTKTLATLKGGYYLFFCDAATYDAHEPALVADTYPPPGYPSVNPDDASRLDPYDRSVRGDGKVIFPFTAWPWSAQYLDEGLAAYRAIAQDLDASVRNKLHCIRGVQADGIGNAVAGTIWRQHRRPIDPGFVPGKDPTPVFDDQPGDKGPGDGTQPAWSARLATLPPDNIHTVKNSTLEHMALMDDSGVRAKLLGLLRPGVAHAENQVVAGETRIVPAPIEELNKVMRDLSEIAQRKESDAARLKAAKEYVAPIPFAERRALLARGMMELVRGPVGRPYARPARAR